MMINVLKNENILTLDLVGRLDTTTAPSFEATVNSLPDEVTNLVIDLKEVNYVSSAGLRVLLSAQKKMNKIGSMKLINVCEMVMEVFEITGFVDILTIE